MKIPLAPRDHACDSFGDGDGEESEGVTDMVRKVMMRMNHGLERQPGDGDGAVDDHGNHGSPAPFPNPKAFRTLKP